MALQALLDEDIPSSPILGLTLNNSSVGESPLSPESDLCAFQSSSDLSAESSLPLNVISTGTIPLAASLMDSRKREHQMQYFSAQVAAKRLKTDGQNELRKYINANEDEREIMRIAMMIKIAGRMDDSFTAGAEVWDIPSHVLMNIDKYTIRLLLSSRVSAYNGTPILKLLLGIIERKHWGLKPSCIHDENGKWDKIVTYARDRLTQRKAEIKKLLDVSIEDDTSVNADGEKTYRGKNIIELCNALHQIGKKSIPTGTGVVVTPEMCAHIALLWLVFLENPTGKYWSAVDQTLTNIHKKAGGKPNKVSGYLKHILDTNREWFSGADLTALGKVTPSAYQVELDAALESGRVEEITEKSYDIDEAQ